MSKGLFWVSSLSVFLFACGGGNESNAEKTFTISTDVTEGGSISPSTIAAVQGSTNQFTLAASEGYKLMSVSGCDGNLEGNTYTTGSISQACTVSATYALIEYSVAVESTSGGSISPQSVALTMGESVEFLATADDGYYLKSFTGCEGTRVDNTFLIENVSNNCTVSATFSKQNIRKGLAAHYYFKDQNIAEATSTAANTQYLLEGAAVPILPFFENMTFGKEVVEFTYKALAELPQRQIDYEGDAASDYMSDMYSYAAANYNLEDYQVYMMYTPKIDHDLSMAWTTLSPSSWQLDDHTYTFYPLVLAGYEGVTAPHFAHELGHEYGFGHSAAIWCSGEMTGIIPLSLRFPQFCDENTKKEYSYFPYGDFYGIMGGYRGQVNAVWKAQAGWITEQQVSIVTDDTHLTIEPSNVKSNGIKAGSINLSEHGHENMSYWVSFSTEDYQYWDGKDKTNVTPDSVQIRLYVPNADEVFPNGMKSPETYLWHTGEGEEGAVLLPGESLHDTVRGIKWTFVERDDLTNLPRAVVSIERSLISLSYEETPSELTVTFNNGNSKPVEITNVTIKGQAYQDFAIESDKCANTTVAANGTCQIVVSGAAKMWEAEDVLGNGAVLLIENSDLLRPYAAIELRDVAHPNLVE
ncbi:hypothetical protein JC525_18500 [Alteromonas sp. IB21]|uniref:InlB B-repeat-containing protein n=1 Tax=Alteromonas sp. IB21 TaxID=2779369 RepID=UPI0018E70B9B|nr:hypothetical protein [Alteromonas sp. IB21]MBJ2130922.1 hypothetical protein [Alteromonas sp. IB21]